MAEPIDFQALEERLKAAARRHDLVVQELGPIGDDALLLLRPATLHSGPKLLITAGFHGDEPASCFGIAQFLESATPELLRQLNLSFLPLVNPTGLRHGRRENDWGENPNAGFCHTRSGQPEVSREGALLIAHAAQLCQLGADGLLTLHEDIEQLRFYAYSFEQSAEPGPFSMELVDIGRRFFGLVPDGPLEGGQVQGGLFYRFCESSFEDALFHLGVPRTVCTETPGLAPLPLRVDATVALIQGFCQLAQSV